MVEIKKFSPVDSRQWRSSELPKDAQELQAMVFKNHGRIIPPEQAAELWRAFEFGVTEDQLVLLCTAFPYMEAQLQRAPKRGSQKTT